MLSTHIFVVLAASDTGFCKEVLRQVIHTVAGWDNSAELVTLAVPLVSSTDYSVARYDAWYQDNVVDYCEAMNMRGGILGNMATDE